MDRLSYSVKIEGPLFDRRGKRQIQRESFEAIEELLYIGENFLMKRLRPQPAGAYISLGEGGTSTGNYRRNISSESDQLRMLGEIHDGGVKYGPWLEGVSNRNRATRFKGYHSFQLASQLVQKEGKEVLQKHMRKFVRRQNKR